MGLGSVALPLEDVANIHSPRHAGFIFLHLVYKLGRTVAILRPGNVKNTTSWNSHQ